MRNHQPAPAAPLSHHERPTGNVSDLAGLPPHLPESQDTARQRLQSPRRPTRPVIAADSRPADVAWPQMIWPVPRGTELAGAAVWLTALDPQADAPELFSALDHDSVWHHVAGRPASLAAYRDILTVRAGQRDWHQWTVRDRGSGAVVGTSSYLEASAADARVEIGATAYAPSVWGTRVNPETKLLLLGCAFEILRAGRVQLKTDVRNQRSQHAIARLGARYEGTLRRYQRRGDGTVRDTALFSVTAEDWPAVRARLQARLGGADAT